MVSVPQASEPYALSLRALADRWCTSTETLRRRFQAGQLDGFQEGRVIRIFMSEVKRIECQRPIGLLPIEENIVSLTANHAFDDRLERMTLA